MGSWGFVFLAYGIVWGVVLIYLFSLKRRLGKAERELESLGLEEKSQNHAKN